jgi:hypothetical protein
MNEMKMTKMKNIRLLVPLILHFGIVTLACAQNPAHPKESANELVRSVISEEQSAGKQDQSLWQYRVNKNSEGRMLTKEVIETRDGSLERLIAIDGTPLNAEQRREEEERIRKLIENPREQQKLERIRKKDAEQCDSFLRMIPDAFIFSYQGTDGDLVKLSFQPNPAFDPPSREARVLHEMEGNLVVKLHPRRLVAINGRLEEEVKFAGGLLGYLERGGSFHVERKDVGSGHWELTTVETSMKGKVLFLKTIDVQERETRTQFSPVPKDIRLREAAQILENPQTLTAQK